MAIALQPDSPNGELTHKDYQNKLNEVIGVLNPLDANSTTILYIDDESKLPNVSGGVCTPDDDTYLFLANGLTLTTRFSIINEGIHIEGAGVFSKAGVTYTGTGDFITASEQDLSIHNIKFFTPNANSTFNCTATAGGLATLFLDSVNIHDSPQVGLLHNVSPVFPNLVCIDFVQGWKFSGTIIVGLNVGSAYMQDDGVSGGVHFDLQDATFFGFDFIGVKMEGTGIGLKSTVGGTGNVFSNIEAVVYNCTFGLSQAMTPLAGFTNGSNANAWDFRDNSPSNQVPNSSQIADMYLLDMNTVPVAVAGTFYDIGTPVAGSWQSDISNRFTLNSAGFIQYVGIRPITVLIIAYASVSKSGGGGDEIEMRLAKNWNPSDTGILKSRNVTEDTAPSTIISTALISFQPNDHVRVIFANNGSTSDIEVQLAKIEIGGRD